MKKTLLLFLFLPFLGFSQVDLVQWTASTDLKPTFLNNYITASDVTGAGLTTGPTASYDGIIGTGWPTGNNIDTGKYFQITVSPLLDGAFTLNEIQFTYKGDSKAYQVQYSKQANFSSPLTLATVTNAVPNNTPTSGNLTGLNIPVNSGEKLYIRFYSYNGGGNWKLMNNNLLKLRGTINNIPSPLNGNYIIGSATGANFSTITTAVNSLNTLGSSGAVNFLLDNTNYNVTTSETFPIIINSYTGNTNYKTTFKPNTGKTVTIEGTNSSNNAETVFKLNGVDNIIFDGSNNGTTTKNLTIYNNNQSNNSRAVIWIASENNTNGALSNEIKNLTLQQYSKGSYDYSIGVFAGGTSSISSAAEVANSTNTIKNITFTGVGQAIYLNGISTSLSSNWKIQNNTIGGTTNANKPYVGVNLNNAKDYEISGNLISGLLKTDSQQSTINHAGIAILGTSNGTIFNNNINDVYDTTQNTYCAGIYLDSGNNTVYNNFISNIRTSVTDDNNYNFSTKGHGIYIKSGASNKIYFNSISMNASSSGGRSSCLYIVGGSSIDVRNNIFYNSQTSGTQYTIFTDLTNSIFSLLNNNDHYVTNNASHFSARLQSTDYTTLSNWQTATGKESNPRNFLPVFLSDLHLNTTNTTNDDLIGQAISGITTDIDGETRVKPYMGADEVAKCIPNGDQIAFGSNSWIGYVYKWTGTTPNPTTPSTLPISANSTYIGYVTENTLFDRNVGSGAVAGSTTNINCDTPPTDNFFVRYKMTAITVAGNYNITIGSDDGARLYIDGTLVNGLNQWGDHSYTTLATQYTFTAGTHNFVLEYYENAGASRVNFSYGFVGNNVTATNPYGDKVWNVYGYTTANFSIPASSYAGSYIDNNLNINTTTSWNKNASPSSASTWSGAPVPVDNFTTSHKRKGFPCGLYNIVVTNCDDDTQIYLNDNLIYTAGGNIGNNTTPIPGGTYALNKDSRIEIRLREDAGDALLGVNFVDVPFNYTGATNPPANSSIIINNDLTLSNDLEVCSCTVVAGKTLTIATDKVLTVNENIIVNNTGKMVVLNSGSLVQTNNTSTYTGNSTSFELNRNTTPVNRFDFTYWSSPVSGQTLYNLSPNTLYDKYLEYDSSVDNWKYLDGGNYVMQPGKGYIVRAPSSYDVSGNPQIFQGKFVGAPNNGIISLPVINKSGNTTTTNLIGNPYPSALNADQFYIDNSTLIKGTFYFWTHSTTVVPNPNGGQYSYSDSDYISYNATGATGTGDTTNCTTCGGKKLNGNIASGQGFFVEAKTNGNLTFNNALRVKTTATNNQFSKSAKTTIEKNRVWLNLVNAAGAYNEMLLGYITGATNELDEAYDGNSYAGATALYSILDENNLVIQGRALPFEEQKEIIPLGYTASSATEYTIGIESVDGFFKDKNVYLLDKTKNVTTNLSSNRYAFTTETGTFNDRFVLSFTSKTLGTGDFEKLENGISVSVKNKAINLLSSQENIKEVSVYDISGRQLYNKTKIGATELQIGNLQSSNQVLLVKVTLENNFTSTKKVIFQ